MRVILLVTNSKSCQYNAKNYANYFPNIMP